MWLDNVRPMRLSYCSRLRPNQTWSTSHNRCRWIMVQRSKLSPDYFACIVRMRIPAQTMEYQQRIALWNMEQKRHLEMEQKKKSIINRIRLRKRKSVRWEKMECREWLRIESINLDLFIEILNESNGIDRFQFNFESIILTDKFWLISEQK